ncbi:MAG TPA: NUDIX hydrolase [Mycobacteriales bacterium]|nr:NUDIX hydrolase [Mycobacteriales bacterium]
MRGDGDGWTRCAAGHRHWGRNGAAGLFLRDGQRVVLQHRALWSHQGGTWGVPGGARDSDETVIEAALRETAEEAGIDPAAVRPYGLLVDDHGGWSYSTVLGVPVKPVDPVPTGGESEDVRWVDVADVDGLPLHPGFAAAWPVLRDAPPPLLLVVDAANVVGARGRGDGWWRDRAGATARLLDALAPLAGGLTDLPDGVPTGGLDLVIPRIVVVVEGAARAVLDGRGEWPVEVVAAPGEGDDTLVEVAGDQGVVVTADRGLRARLDAAGARWTGPSWLLRQLDGG